MRHFFLLVISICSGVFVFSQTEGTAKMYGELLYDKAFDHFECALEDTCSLSFKDAVFLVENTFMNEQLHRDLFDLHIENLRDNVLGLIKVNNLDYHGADKEEIEKYAAIFTVMCDTFSINYGDTILPHYPFTYDFEDIWGYNNWTSMFVTKLLATGKGNCHSMPSLYKIIADEVDADAHIAIAPNHYYIKHYSKTKGWYNTELTSAGFPIDAWYMGTGYIHIDGIVNKLYMEALDDKQSLVLCLIDLAKGYQQKFGNMDGTFMMKCIDLALKHYPHYIHALLLKTDVLKAQFFNIMEENYAEYPSQVFHIPEAKALFNQMEQMAQQIHLMGYRRMPKAMYLDWLNSLIEEREKFTNKKISNFNSAK